MAVIVCRWFMLSGEGKAGWLHWDGVWVVILVGKRHHSCFNSRMGALLARIWKVLPVTWVTT